MSANPALAQCAQATQPGYALSCFIDFILNLPKESKCFHFLGKFDVFCCVAYSNFFIPIITEVLKLLLFGMNVLHLDLFVTLSF